jgi:A/G-specific adenine glycosylase
VLWLEGAVRHVFTRFSLDLQVAVARAKRGAIPGAVWLAPDKLGEVALPTVMHKVARLAMAEEGE